MEWEIAMDGRKRHMGDSFPVTEDDGDLQDDNVQDDEEGPEPTRKTLVDIQQGTERFHFKGGVKGSNECKSRLVDIRTPRNQGTERTFTRGNRWMEKALEPDPVKDEGSGPDPGTRSNGRHGRHSKETPDPTAPLEEPRPEERELDPE